MSQHNMKGFMADQHNDGGFSLNFMQASVIWGTSDKLGNGEASGLDVDQEQGRLDSTSGNVISPSTDVGRSMTVYSPSVRSPPFFEELQTSGSDARSINLGSSDDELYVHANEIELLLYQIRQIRRATRRGIPLPKAMRIVMGIGRSRNATADLCSSAYTMTHDFPSAFQTNVGETHKATHQLHIPLPSHSASRHSNSFSSDRFTSGGSYSMCSSSNTNSGIGKHKNFHSSDDRNSSHISTSGNDYGGIESGDDDNIRCYSRCNASSHASSQKKSGKANGERTCEIISSLGDRYSKTVPPQFSRPFEDAYAVSPTVLSSSTDISPWNDAGNRALRAANISRQTEIISKKMHHHRQNLKQASGCDSISITLRLNFPSDSAESVATARSSTRTETVNLVIPSASAGKNADGRKIQEGELQPLRVRVLDPNRILSNKQRKDNKVSFNYPADRSVTAVVEEGEEPIAVVRVKIIED